MCASLFRCINMSLSMYLQRVNFLLQYEQVQQTLGGLLNTYEWSLLERVHHVKGGKTWGPSSRGEDDGACQVPHA